MLSQRRRTVAVKKIRLVLDNGGMRCAIIEHNQVIPSVTKVSFIHPSKTARFPVQHFAAIANDRAHSDERRPADSESVPDAKSGRGRFRASRRCNERPALEPSLASLGRMRFEIRCSLGDQRREGNSRQLYELRH